MCIAGLRYGILMTDGTEGHTMHGGGHIERPGAFYRYRDGKMRCGLTVASWQLTDQMEGDGGFAVVPGSECCAYMMLFLQPQSAHPI